MAIGRSFIIVQTFLVITMRLITVITDSYSKCVIAVIACRYCCNNRCYSKPSRRRFCFVFHHARNTRVVITQWVPSCYCCNFPFGSSPILLFPDPVSNGLGGNRETKSSISIKTAARGLGYMEPHIISNVKIRT